MTAPTTEHTKSSALTGPVSAQSAAGGIDHSRTGLRLLKPIAEPALILEAQEAARELIQKTLKEGRDYGKVPGVERSTLLKPGAERIALSFGCKYGDPQIVSQEIDHDRLVNWSKRRKDWYGAKGARKFNWKEESGTSRGLYRYVIRRDVIEVESGRVVGHGVGSCSTMESKYIDRPRDCENTVLKIASKRAMVDGCLTTFGLSDQFTQDVEDMPADDHTADDRGDAHDDPAPEPITAETPWPTGANKDTPIGALPKSFLEWAAQPGRKFGVRTAEWSAACAAVLAQRANCAKLGCDPAGRWHDESCPLFVETDPPDAEHVETGKTNGDVEPGEPGEALNR